MANFWRFKRGDFSTNIPDLDAWSLQLSWVQIWTHDHYSLPVYRFGCIIATTLLCPLQQLSLCMNPDRYLLSSSYQLRHFLPARMGGVKHFLFTLSIAYSTYLTLLQSKNNDQLFNFFSFAHSLLTGDIYVNYRKPWVTWSNLRSQKGWYV